MANIDPVRLLQANPAENLSNLNTADQAESLKDQSVTSFPKELQAAKQNGQEDDASLDKKSQNQLDTTPNLQNLPANTPVVPTQAANIADQPKAAEETVFAGLALAKPTLTQLGVPQILTAQEDPNTQVATQAGAQIAKDDSQALLASMTSDVITGVQGEKDKKSLDATVTVADSAAAALAQAAGLLNTQNATTPFIEQVSVSNVEPAIAMVQQSAVGNIQAQNASNIVLDQVTPQVSANPLMSTTQDTLAADQPQTKSDVAVQASINALNAADALIQTNANVVAAQDIQQKPVNSGTNAAVVANIQDVATGLQTVQAPTQTLATTVAQAPVIAQQEATGPAQNTDSALPTLDAKDAKLVQVQAPQASILAAATVATAAQAQDAAPVQNSSGQVQASVTKNPKVESNPTSAQDTGSIVQDQRLDNAKISNFNIQKSNIAEDAAAKKAGVKAEVVENAKVSSNNNGGNISGISSQTITSPFNQELRLQQSAQTLKLEPQQASLATGPLHVEVMRVLKEGGGRVVMEVTPPDQGSIQLDLRLDGNGRAYLIVEGASDSTKARLEQGGSQLKEQLAQMGLSLSLDMRDRSSQSDHVPFAFNQNFSNFGNGNSTQVDSLLGDLAPVSRPGITPDGRLSIYA
jgi:hypothetical protein